MKSRFSHDVMYIKVYNLYMLQFNLIVTLSLGFIETGRVISELYSNEVTYSKIIILGAMTWPCCIAL